MTTKSDPQQVLILEPDRLRAATIYGALDAAFPSAVVRMTTDPQCAAAKLTESSTGLFVVAVRGFDLDVITLLTLVGERKPKTTTVLVVTNEVNVKLLRTLLHIPVGGVFDCFDGDIRELEFACRVVASGGSYWSRSVREILQQISLKDYARNNRWSELARGQLPSNSSEDNRFNWSDVTS